MIWSFLLQVTLTNAFYFCTYKDYTHVAFKGTRFARVQIKFNAVHWSTHVPRSCPRGSSISLLRSRSTRCTRQETSRPHYPKLAEIPSLTGITSTQIDILRGADVPCVLHKAGSYLDWYLWDCYLGSTWVSRGSTSRACPSYKYWRVSPVQRRSNRKRWESGLQKRKKKIYRSRAYIVRAIYHHLKKEN